MDLDQLGLCYPAPDDDPVNHRVKAHNLAAVWPVYRAAGARCLIAVGGFADLCIDADNRNVVQVARHIRTWTGGWPLLTP